MTDANLVLGYLDRDSPLAGGVTLDREAAERALGSLASSSGCRWRRSPPAWCGWPTPGWHRR